MLISIKTCWFSLHLSSSKNNPNDTQDVGLYGDANKWPGLNHDENVWKKWGEKQQQNNKLWIKFSHCRHNKNSDTKEKKMVLTRKVKFYSFITD